MLSSPSESFTVASATPTIDYLIGNLPIPDLTKLLSDKDANAVFLLRTINGPYTIQVSKAVIEELGLSIHSDEEALAVLKEIKDLLPEEGQENLHANVDRLIAFAEADIDTEIDLTAITDPFDLIAWARDHSGAKLAIRCEETFAYLLQTLTSE